jgi:hypothetical protein
MNIFTYLWVHHMSYVLNCSSKLIRTHVATIACTHQAHFTRQISDSLITFITSIIHYFVEQFLYKVLICKHLLHSRSCKTILEQLFTFLWSRQPKSCMDQWVHTKKCRFFLTFFVNIYLLKVYLPISFFLWKFSLLIFLLPIDDTYVTWFYKGIALLANYYCLIWMFIHSLSFPGAGI